MFTFYYHTVYTLKINLTGQFGQLLATNQFHQESCAPDQVAIP